MENNIYKAFQNKEEHLRKREQVKELLRKLNINSHEESNKRT